MTMQQTTRKPRKNKLRGRGGMTQKSRGGQDAPRLGAGGANTAPKAALPTMRVTAGGLVLMTKDGARGKPIVQTSARSRRKTMSNGNGNVQTLDADAVARAKVVAIARNIIKTTHDVREAFAATGARLLTVILDDGKESVEWELDAGDWVLLRVSDYEQLLDREQGDLFPITP